MRNSFEGSPGINGPKKQSFQEKVGALRTTIKGKQEKFKEDFGWWKQKTYEKYINVLHFFTIQERRKKLKAMGYRLLENTENPYIVLSENTELAKFSKKDFEYLEKLLGKLKPENRNTDDIYGGGNVKYTSIYDLEAILEYSPVLPEDIDEVLDGKPERSISLSEWGLVREEFRGKKHNISRTIFDPSNEKTVRDVFVYAYSFGTVEHWEHFERHAQYLADVLNHHGKTVLNLWDAQRFPQFFEHIDSFIPYLKPGTFKTILETAAEQIPESVVILAKKELPARFKLPREMVMKGRMADSEISEVRDLAPEIMAAMKSKFSSEEELKRVRGTIEKIFVRNHLPFVGKQFRVFSLLQDKFDKDATSIKSPTLAAHVEQKNQFNAIIFKDLLKTSLLSLEPSLKEFLRLLAEARTILEKKARGDDLDEREIADLQEFLASMEVLRINPLDENSIKNGENVSTYEVLSKEFNCRPGESIVERIERSFLRKIGIRSVEDALALMEETARKTEERNREFAQNPTLRPTDMLKGVQASFFRRNLETGWMANEFVGSFHKDTDATPYDVDLAMVGNEGWDGIKDSVAASYGAYGGLILIVKDEGQYRSDKADTLGTFERFEIQSIGHKNHVGIRTAFPSSEVRGIIVQDYWIHYRNLIEDLKNDIAAKGMYIPLFAQDKTLLYPYEEYQKRRAPYLEARSAGESISRKDFKEMLSGDTINIKAIVERMAEAMPNIYNGQTGVWEGYSLKEHITYLLTQYEKYGKEKTPVGVPVWLMRFMALISDAGKPVAVKWAGGKEGQHGFNTRIARELMNTAGFGSREKDFVATLVGNDIWGEYIKGVKDIATTAKEMRIAAKQAGMSVDQYFDASFAYYFCDAGAYTTDAGARPSLDFLFDFPNKRMSPNYEARTAALRLFLKQ